MVGGRWSVVGVTVVGGRCHCGRWSVVGGWSVGGGFVLRPHRCLGRFYVVPSQYVKKVEMGV